MGPSPCSFAACQALLSIDEQGGLWFVSLIAKAWSTGHLPSIADEQLLFLLHLLRARMSAQQL